MKKLMSLCLAALLIPMSVSAYDYDDDIRKIYITYQDERVDGKFELMEKETAAFGIRTYPSEAARGVKWRSSNTKIATVDQSGKVTAVKQGSCTIYATSTVNKSVYDSVSLTVIKYVKYPDRITITPQSGAVFETGNQIRFTASVYPEDTTERTIYWRVSGCGAIDQDGVLNITDRGEIKVFAYSKNFKTVGEYTLNSSYSNGHFELFGEKYNVPQDRCAIIEFTDNVNYVSAHSNIFASADQAGNGERINIRLDVAGDTVTIYPVAEWKKGDMYIFVKEGICNTNGDKLGRNIKYKLHIREV